MTKAGYQGPADRLALYEELVASVQGVGLLERQDELRLWFVRSWEWVGTLGPK